MQMMGRVMDVVILNFLFIITSIPVVTIGASLTAMNYVTIKMRRNEDTNIVRTYFREFKKNFKKSTKIWCAMLVVMGVLVGDIIICLGVKETIGQVLLLLAITFLIWMIGINVYIYPMLAYLEDKPLEIIKKAVLMAIAYLPHTILMFLVVIIPFALYIADEMVFLSGVLVYLAIGFGMSAYMNSLSLNSVFEKCEILEEREEIVCEI